MTGILVRFAIGCYQFSLTAAPSDKRGKTRTLVHALVHALTHALIRALCQLPKGVRIAEAKLAKVGFQSGCHSRKPATMGGCS